MGGGWESLGIFLSLRCRIVVLRTRDAEPPPTSLDVDTHSPPDADSESHDAAEAPDFIINV